MHPSRMVFVAIGTTIAFLAALVWAGAYFASTGPSDSELPRARMSVPVATAAPAYSDVGGLGGYTYSYAGTDLSPFDASSAPTSASVTVTTATETDTNLNVASRTNTATTAARAESTSRTTAPKPSTVNTMAPRTTTKTTARTILPPTTWTTCAITVTTRTTILVTSNTSKTSTTTLPYLQTNLPSGDDNATEREVVRPRLREEQN
jgi:hypothetical protein